MRRRQFIKLLGGAAAVWPLSLRAQQAGKVWRIGFLTAVSREAYSRLYAGFQEGMRELGYVEGKDFVSEWRSVEGNYERFPELADELARLKVDVIVSGVTAALPALKRATPRFPLLWPTRSIRSESALSRASRGLAATSPDWRARPMTRLPNNWNCWRLSCRTLLGSDFLGTQTVLKTAQSAAKRGGLSLLPIGARSPREIEDAFVALARERVPAAMFVGDAVL
jgi:putative ABC transport system substrate-binding protein